MSFIDSHKRLEKLCSEMYNDNHGLSTYIDEMLGIPSGSYYVPGWDEDLKQLKHYRWVRNQIVHEPECTEENMCEPGDAQWLDNFHSRIMNQTDLLALYAKAMKPRNATESIRTHETEPVTYDYPRQVVNNESPQIHTGFLIFLICVLLIVGIVSVVFIISKII